MNRGLLKVTAKSTVAVALAFCCVWSPCSAAVWADVLNDRATDLLSENIGNALGRRAEAIAMAYAKNADKIFGDTRTLLPTDNVRNLQNWALERSRFWSGLSLKAKSAVSVASKAALSTGGAAVLEQAFVSAQLKADLDKLREVAPGVAGLIPEAGWALYFKNVGQSTIDKSVDLALQTAASAVLASSLRISLKAAGYPVTAMSLAFGNLPDAGDPANNQLMPEPIEANRERFLDWANSMAEKDAELAVLCGESSSCVENASKASPMFALPGNWSWYKFKQDYFRSVGLPALANSAAWVNRYYLIWSGSDYLPASKDLLALSISPSVINQGESIKIQSDVKGALTGNPQLVLRNGAGKEIFRTQFQEFTSLLNDQRRWTYLLSAFEFDPGNYTATTQYVSDGFKGLESAPVPLKVGSRATISINPLSAAVWDAVATISITAKTKGINKGVRLRAVGVDGISVADSAMTRISDGPDGSSDWRIYLNADPLWKGLPDGNFSLKASIIGTDSREIDSSAISLNVKRVDSVPIVVSPPSGVMTSSPDFSTVVNNSVTISGSFKGTGQVGVSIVYPDFGNTEQASLNAQGIWEYRKKFAIDGKFRYRVDVRDASGAKPVTIGQGTITVLPLQNPSISNFTIDKFAIQVGDAVTINVKTTAPVFAVRVVVDQLTGGTVLALTNPSGNQIDWTLVNRVVSGAGSAANQFQRPMWAIATLNDLNRTEVPASVPIKLTVRPTAADGMEVVGETYMDDTVVPAGTTFVKTWTLKNTGTTTWNSGYCLQPLGNETALGSGKSCVVNTVAPNGHQVISVTMRAPAAVNADKSFIQHWRLMTPTGVQVGTLNPYARIIVKGTAAHVLQSNMPEMVPQGSNLSLSVQTDRAAQSVALELSSPNATYQLQGTGTSWALAPVAMGVAGNRAYNIKVTTSGEVTDAKTGSLFIRGSGSSPPVPLAQIAGASATPTDVVVGQAVQFSVQTDSKVKVATLMFDSATSTPIAMGNPSGNGSDWVYFNYAATVGAAANGYARSYWVGGTRLDGSSITAKGPFQVIVRPATAGPVVDSVAPLVGVSGQKVRIIVTGKSLAATVKLQVNDSQCSASVAGVALARREYDCTLGAGTGFKTLTVLGLQGDVISTRQFEVKAAANGGGTSPLPPPVAPLTPQLTKGDNILSGVVWSAKLTTNLPVYAAELVFDVGRRIPFMGGNINWYSDDRSAVFGEAAVYNYTLRIQRTASSTFETYPGGTLEVRARPVSSISPTVISAATIEQGKSHVLQVRVGTAAGRVTSQWADVAEGNLAPDAARTTWQASRVFAQVGSVPYTVRVYDENNNLAGKVDGTVNVVPANVSMRFKDVIGSVGQGQRPKFAIATALSVARVTVQLAGQQPVALPQTAEGTERSFEGLAGPAPAGAAVPYVVQGMSAQGQELARLTGTISVAAAANSLVGASPIPTGGIYQGDTVSWVFATTSSATMHTFWMEFASPIGTVTLNGSSFNRLFKEAPGTYSYRLMGRDDFGNVVPIQGASGTLLIKPKANLQPTIGQIGLNGRAVGAGGRVTISLKENLVVAAQSAGAKGLVMKVSLPQPLGDVYFKLNGANGVQWQSLALPSSLGDYFRGMVKPGVFAAQLYLGTGGVDLATNLGSSVNFNLELTP